MPHLTTHPLDLHPATPFRISRGVQTTAHNLLVSLRAGDLTGLGEAAPRAFFGETLATAEAALRNYAPLLEDADPLAIVAVMDQLERALPHHASARAAIDMALHDLAGQRLGIPVFRLLGLSAAQLPATSFTIAIDDPAAMAGRAAEAAAAGYAILKIKLGTADDAAIVRAIREATGARLRVDANAAWTVKDALRQIAQLAPFGVELVEQPIPPGDVAGLRFLRERSPIPIFADEDCREVADVVRLAGAVDGINIKLAKCGGLARAVEMIHVARAHGLQVMLGCMLESSVGITAAAHLAPLADLLDLDGALLLAHDPFVGARFAAGQVTLPEAPGLGVAPRPPAAPVATTAPPSRQANGAAPAAGHPTRQDAWELMTAHVQQDSLRKHMLAVEAAMRAYARTYGADETLWGITGLLHDSDYEEYPDLHEHTQVSAGWLRERGYDERIIHAILAHNDVNNLPREDLLARALVACDEITGLVTAAALVRPDKSIMELEAPSIRKKMKDKAFARSIHREDIVNGAAALGVDLDAHIAFVIAAMRTIAPELGLAGAAPTTA